MKKIYIISMLLFGIALSVKAQNFEDTFNAFAKQNQEKFDSFVDSINKQFAEAMEANMKAFTGEQPKVRDPKPKPVKIPEAAQQPPLPLPDLEPLQPGKPERPAPVRPPLQEIQPPVQVKPAEPDSIPKSAEPIQPAPSPEQVDMLDFNLFGEYVQIIKQPFPDRLSDITPKNVSNFWIRLSECDYLGMLQACRNMQKYSAFNDWAIYQMVLEFTRNIYDGHYNEQAVMATFLLNQLGIEAKVGFDDQHLFCLLDVGQQLYGITYVKIANRQYYIFETDTSYTTTKGRSFRTYDMPFPKPTRSIDMHIRQPLKSAPIILQDTIIQFDMNMIDFYRTYPQVDIEVYANAVPSEEFCTSVDRIIKPYTDSRTPYKAVELLLAYVQFGFEYATDDEQFGYEKPFFCEENYYYPKNDCEDRSVLFSFLVRRLLHLDVVLIDYPGHIATAVHFPSEVDGESVFYNGKRYVICDPTYIGASIGMEMPDFTPEDRTVVPLK